MENGQLQQFYPEEPLLKKYIDYYYFLKTDDDFYSAYYSFPKEAYSLNIHKSVSADIEGNTIFVQGDLSNDYRCILQGKYNAPLLVKLGGKLDKITIHFKPLGLNHFIKQPLGEIASQPSQLFNCWQSEPGYKEFLNDFFEKDNLNSRVQLIERFLLTQYRSLTIAPTLEKALEMLTDFEQDHPIAHIANTLSLSDKAFNRLFHKHFGISPVTYKTIARFRHSLKNKLFSQQFNSLTEIGYQSNFYDQAYFIKMYRKITGDNPSQFFNSIAKLADGQLIFKFIRA
ncbi:MAG: helix-turn-helix domain-containing protein [Mucilaginibacter sp.]